MGLFKIAYASGKNLQEAKVNASAYLHEALEGKSLQELQIIAKEELLLKPGKLGTEQLREYIIKVVKDKCFGGFWAIY